MASTMQLLIILNIIIVSSKQIATFDLNKTDTIVDETKTHPVNIDFWVPKLNVQSLKNETSSYSVVVEYSNAWLQVEDVTGITLDLVCGDANSTCNCEYYTTNFSGCFSDSKNLTRDSCSENSMCQQVFEAIPGQCCIRIVVYTTTEKEMSIWNTWKFTEIDMPRVEILRHNKTSQVPTNITETAEPESHPVNYIILYTTSSISFIIIIIIIIAICIILVIRNRNSRITYSTVDVSENAQGHSDILSTEKENVLIMNYPETDEHNENVEGLIRQLEDSLDYKVINASHSHDKIVAMGPAEWAAYSVQSAHKIIVISSKGAYHNLQGNNLLQILSSLQMPNDLQRLIFSIQWITLVNDYRLRNDYNRVYNIRFSTTDSSYLLKGAVPGSHFVLPEHFHVLSDILRGH